MTIDVKDKTEIFFDNLLKDVCKFGAVMEKISLNQLKRRGAPQLGHAPQKGIIRYISIVPSQLLWHIDKLLQIRM